VAGVSQGAARTRIIAHANDYSMKLKPVESKRRSIPLSDSDARVKDLGMSEEEVEDATEKEVGKIAELQRVFYADARFALLIVLQGRDASGKDGTIRKVFTAVNPQGCSVTSFKAPTEAELAQDYLWRIHLHIPPRRMIGIFNRSHYEDVIVPRVHDLVPRRVLEDRYKQINAFEKMLTENRVVILKFLLHISRAEQRKRLQERIDDPQKNWKFQLGDLEDRSRWNAFTKAYHAALASTSTKWAPWYIVPADDKKVRNYLISRMIASTLKSLKLRYPPANPDIVGLEVK
jgi:PPK2 family polyphosphate:nucleotide phosphotransferase